jgi:hypothetical protein
MKKYQRVKLSLLKRSAMTGIACPVCGATESSVSYVRLRGFGILRQRKCLSCGAEFKTGETVLSAPDSKKS